MPSYKTTPTSAEFDYLIVGGGLSGCVLASRLSQASFSVLLVEAGPDEHTNPQILNPIGGPLLHNTPLEYNYKTAPQEHANGRVMANYGGKVLSGGSSVNYGAWTRGHSVDFDAWADLVGDPRWTYKSLLKYFIKTEHHHLTEGDPKVHGFEGNIYTIAADRGFPLTKPIQAMLESIGLEHNKDHNSGNPLGYGNWTENWRDAKRQPAGAVYDMSKVTILLNTFVKRVTTANSSTGTLEATGIELADGTLYTARKEVIVSCGALRTPQILMLSGLGPKSELSKHGIDTVLDIPGVGSNLHDHICVGQYWKLKSPEKGLALGHPNFNSPSYLEGFPVSWVSTVSVPSETIKAARVSDGHGTSTDEYSSRGARSHLELVYAYVPTNDFWNEWNLPMDGTLITSAGLCLLPTSRGSVSLNSTDPKADPCIDPNYLATETDRAIVREGMRLNMRAVESEPGKSIIEAEHPPPGCPPLNSNSSNDDLDSRMRKVAATWFHPAGTAAMGSVIDTECRVKGVQKLRVVDASILPIPLAAHYQAPMYAVAELMADVILGRYGDGE